jgi:acyl carrier protein
MVQTAGVWRAVWEALAAEGQPAPGLDPAPQTPLAQGGLELTSLGLVRALVRIEQRLDLQLDDGALVAADFQTVDDVVRLVTRSVAERGSIQSTADIHLVTQGSQNIKDGDLGVS